MLQTNPLTGEQKFHYLLIFSKHPITICTRLLELWRQRTNSKRNITTTYQTMKPPSQSFCLISDQRSVSRKQQNGKAAWAVKRWGCHLLVWFTLAGNSSRCSTGTVLSLIFQIGNLAQALTSAKLEYTQLLKIELYLFFGTKWFIQRRFLKCCGFGCPS